PISGKEDPRDMVGHAMGKGEKDHLRLRSDLLGRGIAEGQRGCPEKGGIDLGNRKTRVTAGGHSRHPHPRMPQEDAQQFLSRIAACPEDSCLHHGLSPGCPARGGWSLVSQTGHVSSGTADGESVRNPGKTAEMVPPKKREASASLAGISVWR